MKISGEQETIGTGFLAVVPTMPSSLAAPAVNYSVRYFRSDWYYWKKKIYHKNIVILITFPGAMLRTGF